MVANSAEQEELEELVWEEDLANPLLSSSQTPLVDLLSQEDPMAKPSFKWHLMNLRPSNELNLLASVATASPKPTSHATKTKSTQSTFYSRREPRNSETLEELEPEQEQALEANPLLRTSRLHNNHQLSSSRQPKTSQSLLNQITTTTMVTETTITTSPEEERVEPVLAVKDQHSNETNSCAPAGPANR